MLRVGNALLDALRRSVLRERRAAERRGGGPHGDRGNQENALSPGAYQLTVVASYAGGSSPASKPLSLTIVAAPTTPSAPTLLPADSNGSPGGETTYLTSPYLTGTALADATVQLLNAGGTVLNTTKVNTCGHVPGPGARTARRRLLLVPTST